MSRQAVTKCGLSGVYTSKTMGNIRRRPQKLEARLTCTGRASIIGSRSPSANACLVAMRGLIARSAFLIIPLLIAALARPQPPAADDKGSIEGTVTDASAGDPLRKATITLGAAQSDIPDSISDSNGHFAFTGLAPGDYSIHAERQGFLDFAYAATIHLAAGQKIKDIRLALIRNAAIFGRVVDPDGDPIPEAGVTVYRLGWDKGKRHFEKGSYATADDRGEFRVGKLKPGRYFVLAIALPKSSSTVRSKQFQPTWYPSELDPGSASAVILHAGQELSGIDVRLKFGAVHAIRGRVIGLGQASEAGVVSVGRPGAINVNATRISLLGDGPLVNGTSAEPNGEFAFASLAPGMYELRLRQSMRDDVGKTTVVVGDEDLKDVVIQYTPPRLIRGKIRMDGQPHARLSGLIVQLSIEGTFLPKEAAVKEDGSFEFKRVDAGQYSVAVRGDRTGPLYVKAVRVGSVDFPKRMLDLELAGDVPVEIVLGRAGSIRGTLKTESADFAHVAVLLIPDGVDAEQRSRGSQKGVVEMSGAFTLQNVPPGDYKLLAWQNLPEGAWLDNDFWKEVEGKGVKVTIAESDNQQVEVPLMSPLETAALLTRLGIE
jgi:protocatechuate 3,4-dioxygenase beta subunit